MCRESQTAYVWDGKLFGDQVCMHSFWDYEYDFNLRSGGFTADPVMGDMFLRCLLKWWSRNLLLQSPPLSEALTQFQQPAPDFSIASSGGPMRLRAENCPEWIFDISGVGRRFLLHIPEKAIWGRFLMLPSALHLHPLGRIFLWLTREFTCLPFLLSSSPPPLPILSLSISFRFQKRIFPSISSQGQHPKPYSLFFLHW